MITLACVPDTHAPLHDIRAWGAMCNALADIKPDKGVHMGDFFDLESLSAHGKNKPSLNTLRQEINGGRRCVRDLESLCDDWTITLGNHEDRLSRFLMKNAPELFDEVDIEDLFGLEDWKVVPYLAHHQVGKMIFTHCIDPMTVGVNAVRTTGQLAGKSITIGHVHRLQVEYFGKITGKHFVAHCPGWLGSEKAATYMSKAKIYSQWMQGFSLIHFEDNGNFHLVPVAITNGKCVVNGKVYRG